ncbi:hypothetical protein [Prauserella muralis]|uniref:hypothetical protein n=1 Tax=Prauserella muralis TaxID=588067 RepID=UPI0011BDC796|nr:hypothetical protein [Prauserella muralis]
MQHALVGGITASFPAARVVDEGIGPAYDHVAGVVEVDSEVVNDPVTLALPGVDDDGVAAVGRPEDLADVEIVCLHPRAAPHSPTARDNPAHAHTPEGIVVVRHCSTASLRYTVAVSRASESNSWIV